MGKDVKISFEVFKKMLLITDDMLADREINIQDISEINKSLHKKLDAMIKRELYTKYKTADTKTEREQAIKDYLMFDINK